MRKMIKVVGCSAILALTLLAGTGSADARTTRPTPPIVIAPIVQTTGVTWEGLGFTALGVTWE